MEVEVDQTLFLEHQKMFKCFANEIIQEIILSKFYFQFYFWKEKRA